MVNQPEQAEQSKKVYLMPCSGRERLNIPRGHVYGVNVGGVNQGFLPLDEAIKQYPDAKKSESDSLCGSCLADIKRTG